MKYSITFLLAVLAFSRAACIPAERRSETAAELSCAGEHDKTSESATTHSEMQHGKYQHQHHDRPTTNTPQPGTNSSATTHTNTPSMIPASLVPAFGITAGVDPEHGNCKGLNGILIPCSCPPSRDAFIAKMVEFVAAGNAEGTPVSFPTDTSLKSQITRLSTSIVTLQNFNGRPGSGCPASSTTFVGQRAKLLALL